VHATGPSPTEPPSPPPLPEVAPGPQALGSPIEVRPVRTEYASCAAAPAKAGTVPAVYGTTCYRLADPWFVIDRLDEVAVTFASDVNGLVSETNGQLVLTMTPADRAVFAARTGKQIGRQVALVVAGQVWFAPSIASPIDGGQLSLDLPVLRLRSLLAAMELSPA
jgi:preprotein translocase subunit SecD